MASKRIKVVAIGLGTMAMVGGGAALAQSAVAAPSPQPGKTAAAAGNHAAHARHVLHLDETYSGKDKTTMDRVEVSGSVTAVSATSITVTATDNYSKVFVVDATTKVMRLDPTATPKRVAATIADVHTGDTVIVGGHGPTGQDLSAARIAIRP